MCNIINQTFLSSDLCISTIYFGKSFFVESIPSSVTLIKTKCMNSLMLVWNLNSFADWNQLSGPYGRQFNPPTQTRSKDFSTLLQDTSPESIIELLTFAWISFIIARGCHSYEVNDLRRFAQDIADILCEHFQVFNEYCYRLQTIQTADFRNYSTLYRNSFHDIGYTNWQHNAISKGEISLGAYYVGLVFIFIIMVLILKQNIITVS